MGSSLYFWGCPGCPDAVATELFVLLVGIRSMSDNLEKGKAVIKTKRVR